ncbi:MAG: hypothetical protein PVI06_03520 [Desulfobacterales bacterium]
MTDKIITLEDRGGPFQMVFRRTLRMVPERDKEDKKLQRLIAFRLKIDGESATTEYLIRKINEAIKCAYTGSFYDFLKDDLQKTSCNPRRKNSNSPGAT